MANPSIPVWLIRQALAIDLLAHRRARQALKLDGINASRYSNAVQDGEYGLIDTIEKLTGTQILRRRKNG